MQSPGVANSNSPGVANASSGSATNDGTTPPSSVVPLSIAQGDSESLDVSSQGQTVSIFARNVDLRLVLSNLAEESGVNIVVAEDIEATVTTTLKNVPLWDAFDAILKVNGLSWSVKSDIVFVTQPTSTGESGQGNSQPGQRVQVFELHYTSSEEVLQVVKGLLSVSGRAFTHVADGKNQRQTRERIVVEDFGERIGAIANYLASVDTPPRQVLIEAHVLQVTLNESQRHGVNLDSFARLAGGRVHVDAMGFADPDVRPGFMIGIENRDLNGLIEMLQSESNVRTLASPKVLVVNGQEARIQIGSKFGYFVTTTTQTGTFQNVDFLDIGVVLQVQPTIADDGQVLMNVEPKVSGGRINADSGLPEEDTTEAATTVLLRDGYGMVIGGLIKESDDQSKSWIPWLGERKFIGKLFRRQSEDVQRQEVIIALTPHILPYPVDIECRERFGLQAAANNRGLVTGAAYRPNVQMIGGSDVLHAVGEELPIGNTNSQIKTIDSNRGELQLSSNLPDLASPEARNANANSLGAKNTTQQLPLPPTSYSAESDQIQNGQPVSSLNQVPGLPRLPLNR